MGFRTNSRRIQPPQVDFSTFKASVLAADERAQLTLRQDAAIAVAAHNAGLSAPGTPQNGRSQSHGTAFRQALESATGKQASTDRAQVPAELMQLPQPQRVRRLTRQISALFSEYDNGRCSLDVFRERLRQLGVDETGEFRKALRTPADLTFASLFRALCSVDPVPGSAAGSPSARPGAPAVSDLHMQVGGRAVPSAGRRLGPPGNRPSSDVISWRGQEQEYIVREDTESPAARGRRARGSGAYGTQGPMPSGSRGRGGGGGGGAGDAIRMGAPMGGPGVGVVGMDMRGGRVATPMSSEQSHSQSQVAAGRATHQVGAQVSTGRYDARAMLETGAGDVIFGRGTAMPGAEREGISVAGAVTMHNSRAGESGAHAASMLRAVQGGRGVAASLVDDADKARDDARWESLAQSTARETMRGAAAEGLTSSGVNSMGAVAVPHSRAGHGLPDKGLLREQVYSLVRQLDKGMLTASGFRSRAAQMQIDIPSAVQKLLQDFEANGRADFSRFVRGFEEYLHAKAIEQQQQQLAEAEATGGAGAYVESDSERKAREARDVAAGTAGGRSRGLARVGGATVAHGDIIGWQGEAASRAGQEEEDMLRRRGLRPSMTRNRQLWDTRGGPSDPISWAPAGQARPGEGGGVGGPQSSLAMRATRKGRGPTAIQGRSAGNFIAWAGGAVGPSAGQGVGSDQLASADRATMLAGVSGDPTYNGGTGGKGGDILPDGRMIGLGRAHVDTELGRLAHEKQIVPFGTQRDIPRTEKYARAQDGHYHRTGSPVQADGPSAAHRHG